MTIQESDPAEVNSTPREPLRDKGVSAPPDGLAAGHAKSAVAQTLPGTVPHAFDAELQKDSSRLDATLRQLLKDVRAADQEHESQTSSLAARRATATRQEELSAAGQQAGAKQKLENVQSERVKVKRALSPLARPAHPVLAEVIEAPKSFPDDLDHPAKRFDDFVAKFQQSVKDGAFYYYRPADNRNRSAVIAVLAGCLTVLAYFLTRGSSLYPLGFIGLIVWSLFAGLVVSLRFFKGNGDLYHLRYQQLADLFNAVTGIYPHAVRELVAEHEARVSEINRTFDAETATMTASFRERYGALMVRWRAYMSESDDIAPPWNSPKLRADWFVPEREWKPAEGLPRAVRLGTQKVRVLDETIEPSLLVPFPGGVSLLFETAGDEKAHALEGIQAVMLRLLATIPPAKLRFTLFDPVGLGQNVAPFMHLADYDDKLVTARAWTEPNHIEQRLTDLSEHMELVIQKYLRNEYASMEDYNKKAEMVEEPYRVLVVANFPVNFTETSAKRLVSIATNGPRCGVYTLVTVDTEQPPPHGFNLADLERASTVIHTKDAKFWLQDDELGDVPLNLDAPPQGDLFNRIVAYVGNSAKNQAGVRVPFKRIAPERKTWWTASASDGILAPIGISGAAGKQEFSVGKDTRQHALLAGRTGSGKSVLLRVLITNLALRYSPDELELYLIDFKKGVEFKTYAQRGLPHARVIAIESEREFGLSVLEGLDAELTRRGTLFRKTADESGSDIQNLAAYRKRTGKVLPRIMLIVDEFQEFFTDDDPLANRVAQILDRLVRQGRSFGIHLLLGSQTLAGAYSLNRGTMDQMGVRIALQCSETDSRLILSDDNPAARLLSRPGEAIYNHANGMLEGNNRFQTVWLEEDEQNDYLSDIHVLDEERRAGSDDPPRETIVFEGQELAVIDKSASLGQLLAAPNWPPEAPRVVEAWLGDPVAIKAPTSATFRPQAGANLLVVGQDEEAALGITSSTLVSLALQFAPGQVEIKLADLSLEGGPFARRLDPVCEALRPHAIERVPRRRMIEAVEALAAEVKRRIADDEHAATPVYFVIHGLMRARDLRQDDDGPASYGGYGGSFGFGEGDTPPSAPKIPPSQLLTRIVRDGPEVGVHLVAWSDTLNNAQRTLDRSAMREFDLRVVFQMSADDSSALIDGPLAGKLGPHRALFFSEERGLMEKFRPYALPSQPWLDQVEAALAARKGA